MKGSILIFLIGMIICLIFYGVFFFFAGDMAFSEDKDQRFIFWKSTLAYWILTISVMFAGIAIYILWGNGY